MADGDMKIILKNIFHNDEGWSEVLARVWEAGRIYAWCVWAPRANISTCLKTF